jgi:hypothetical protein
MRTPAEFLAGCSGDNEGTGGPPPWGSVGEFPGFMLRRMYILLTRPHQAIGEFGAGDCLTPFLFFLFFTIITVFLRNVTFVLSTAIFTLFQPSEVWRPAPPGLSDVFGIFSGSSSYLTFGTLGGVVNNCLFFGVAVILLAAGLGYGTGTWSRDPAFTVSAYCLPVSYLIFTISEFLQATGLFPDPLQACISSAAFGFAIILMGAIAGWGIIALTKIPADRAVIIAFCWVIIWMQVQGLALVYLVSPVEQDLSQRITAAFFPDSYPIAGVPVHHP